MEKESRDDGRSTTNKPMTEWEFLAGAVLDHESTGIEKVTIWVGGDKNWPGIRIRVNNRPNCYDGEDCFIITIPDYQVVGFVNEGLITAEVMAKIKAWCQKNEEVIIRYSAYQMSTAELLERLKTL